MPTWDDLKQKIQDQQDAQNAQYQASLQPGDTTTPSDTIGNQVQNALGLPQDWRQTIADQKYQAVQPKPVEAIVNPAIAGPEEEGASLAAQGAEALTPKLKAWAQKMMANPDADIEVSGPINMNSFQKLRDAINHKGRVIVKGGM